jgi:hypothetical protein
MNYIVRYYSLFRRTVTTFDRKPVEFRGAGEEWARATGLPLNLKGEVVSGKPLARRYQAELYDRECMFFIGEPVMSPRQKVRALSLLYQERARTLKKQLQQHAGKKTRDIRKARNLLRCNACGAAPDCDSCGAPLDVEVDIADEEDLKPLRQRSPTPSRWCQSEEDDYAAESGRHQSRNREVVRPRDRDREVIYDQSGRTTPRRSATAKKRPSPSTDMSSSSGEETVVPLMSMRTSRPVESEDVETAPLHPRPRTTDAWK